MNDAEMLPCIDDFGESLKAGLAVRPAKRRGRPAQAVHKQPVTLRLDAEALALWRASGKGWQTRAAAVLAQAAPLP